MTEQKLAKRRKAATKETRGTKQRFQFGSRQEEVSPPQVPQLLPAQRAPFQPASGGSGMPSFGGALGGCFQCGQFGHIKRYCPKKALVTCSLYPFHESDEGSMGVDYEGILSPDSEDVCSRCLC